MKTTKNFVTSFLIFFVYFIFFIKFQVNASNFYGFNFDVKSEAVYFVNEDTGNVIYEKNSNQKIPAAALVKMMTIVLILEAVPPNQLTSFLNETLTASGAIFDRLFKKKASHVDIRKGEQVKVIDLLYASILASACEATMMLVEHFVGDNIEEFVEKMNKKAAEIGLNDTNFTDPDGLDCQNQKTTAHDAYILTNYCLKNSFFKKIATTSTYEMPPTNKHAKPRTIVHSNHMTNIGLGGKRYYDEKVRGVKTGAFDNFFNLISTAQNENYSYTLVLLGAPRNSAENSAFADSNNFYNFAFNNLKFETISIPGEKLIPNNVKVKLGVDTDSLVLSTKNQVTLLLPKLIDKSTIYWDTSELPDELYAPIKKGRLIGRVKLKLANQVVDELEVVACKDIKLDLIGFLVMCILKFVKYVWIIIIILIILIIILWLIKKNNYEKNRKIKRQIKFKKYNKKKPKSIKRWNFNIT